jgi:hypothetical protein
MKWDFTPAQVMEGEADYSLCRWQMKADKTRQNNDDNLKGRSSGKDRNLSETLIKL